MVAMLDPEAGSRALILGSTDDLWFAGSFAYGGGPRIPMH